MSMEDRKNFGFDLEPPAGWILFTIGDEIGDSCGAGFDECEITGMRGNCAYVWIKERA